MKKDNIVLSLAFLSAVLAVSLGCGQLSRFTKGADTAAADDILVAPADNEKAEMHQVV